MMCVLRVLYQHVGITYKHNVSGVMYSTYIMFVSDANMLV